MTDLKRSITRRTVTTIDIGKRASVTLHPGDVISFRLDRSKTEFTTTLQACYQMAVKQAKRK